MKLFLRLVLVAAFLLAQTAGIAHQAWHDVGARAAPTDDGKAPQKNPLCDFHTTLASVLGALQGGHVATEAIASTQTVFLAADIQAARFSLLASRSRGPPALL